MAAPEEMSPSQLLKSALSTLRNQKDRLMLLYRNPCRHAALSYKDSCFDTNEDLEGPANIEVKEKRKVVLPSHLKDFAVPTWTKGSRN
ncbi:hypothetical protein P8452_19802 [Trifolium repens]|nr:hypothetical protein P8452_19802 [Trifolium repens]